MSSPFADHACKFDTASQNQTRARHQYDENKEKLTGVKFVDKGNGMHSRRFEHQRKLRLSVAMFCLVYALLHLSNPLVPWVAVSAPVLHPAATRAVKAPSNPPSFLPVSTYSYAHRDLASRVRACHAHSLSV